MRESPNIIDIYDVPPRWVHLSDHNHHLGSENYECINVNAALLSVLGQSDPAVFTDSDSPVVWPWQSGQMTQELLILPVSVGDTSSCQCVGP